MTTAPETATIEADDDLWPNLVRDLEPESRDAASLFVDAVSLLDRFFEDGEFSKRHPEAAATLALTAAVCWLRRDSRR